MPKVYVMWWWSTFQTLYDRHLVQNHNKGNAIDGYIYMATTRAEYGPTKTKTRLEVKKNISKWMNAADDFIMLINWH